MATNYGEGKIDTSPELIIPRVQRVADMEQLSVALVGNRTIWHCLDTQTRIELNHLTYQESQISREAFPEDWMRIIRIPEGYIVDGSHLDLFDDDGKLLVPLHTYEPDRYDNYHTEIAVGYIKNEMQLEGVRGILREMYAFEIGESYLQELKNIQEGRTIDGSDPRD